MGIKKCKVLIEIQSTDAKSDRWRVMLNVNGVRFAIGSECASLRDAQQLRSAFLSALREMQMALGIF